LALLTPDPALHEYTAFFNSKFKIRLEKLSHCVGWVSRLVASGVPTEGNPPTEYRLGQAIANSSFHHFVDYNWDIEKSCPSFVNQPPGMGMKTEPQALEDIQTYVPVIPFWILAR
jgi:hypothetical protein